MPEILSLNNVTFHIHQKIQIVVMLLKMLALLWKKVSGLL